MLLHPWKPVSPARRSGAGPMSRHPLHARLRVEELEARVTPAALNAAPTFDAATDSTVIKGDGPALAHDGPTPLHVSVAAVAVITLCVGWDRRTREGRARVAR